MSWGRNLFVLALLCLATPAWAQVGCVPNPNVNGPPFVDGCSLPAVALNNLLPKSGCQSIAQYGAVADGITDNSAALTSALAAAQTAAPGRLCVQFPPGKYKFTSAFAYSLPAGSPSSLTIRGAGQDVTELVGPTAADLFDITLSGAGSTVHVKNMTLSTPSVAGGYGLKLIQTGTNTNPAAVPPSDVSNVMFRGTDGPNGTNVWTAGVWTNYVSNIAFYNDNFYGTLAGAGGTPTAGSYGIYLAGGGAANTTGVQYNVVSSTFESMFAGIYYGNVQGVTVSGGSNFIANTYGVYVPSGGSSFVSQLTFVGNSCNNWTVCVFDSTGVPFAFYADNTVFVQANANGFTSIGNFAEFHHNTFWGVGANGNGISLTASSNGFVVDGNMFGSTSAANALGAGIIVNTSSNNGAIRANICARSTFCPTVMVVNNASPTTITIAGLANGTSYVVTGAANLSGQLELTISGSTAGLVSGEYVSYQNIVWSGSTNSSNVSNVPITVVDSTHISFPTLAWGGGSYTSGGFVTPTP